MKKTKVVGVGKLKRAQKPVKPKLPGDTPYRLRMGTPNQLSEPTAYKTEATLRAAVVANLRTIHEPWLTRYNTAGIPVINEIINELTNTTIVHEHKRISRCIDEHYGVTLVYEFWKEF